MTQGNIFVISAPSGAGKSSLVDAVAVLDSQLYVSISHTTRTKRPTEQDGVNYHFINKEQFDTLLTNGEFIEHAEVYGNYYGTSGKIIASKLANQIDVILEIDWQGALQVRKLFPHACLIYILPPSQQELVNRLNKRNTDDKKIIAARIAAATNDLLHAKHFDYAIINDKFDTAVQQFYSIITAQRLKSEKILSRYRF